MLFAIQSVWRTYKLGIFEFCIQKVTSVKKVSLPNNAVRKSEYQNVVSIRTIVHNAIQCQAAPFQNSCIFVYPA